MNVVLIGKARVIHLCSIHKTREKEIRPYLSFVKKVGLVQSLHDCRVVSVDDDKAVLVDHLFDLRSIIERDE